MNDYKILYVLKSNKKYLILKCLNNKQNTVVLKISLSAKNTLEEEYLRLVKLDGYSESKLTYLRPLKFSTFDYGPFSSLDYYEQPFIEAPTLSNILRKEEYNLNDYNLNFIIDSLESNSFEISNSSLNKDKFISYKDLIFSALSDVKQKFYYLNLYAQEYIYINKKKYLNLDFAINKLFQTPLYSKFSNKSIHKCLSHANYHGDNILIKSDNIFLIDPDVSIPIVPRSFSMARFVYTFVHDSAEYNDYLINNKWFEEGLADFNIEITSTKSIQNRYASLFGDLLNYTDTSNNILNRIFNNFTSTEVQLSYLYCLIRGIKANQSNIFFLQNDSLNKFSEKGCFIYLNTVKYVNWLLEDFA